MNNEEKILAMLERMQSDIGSMKETLAEHTDALDALLDWTDNVQEVVRVPFVKPRVVK